MTSEDVLWGDDAPPIQFYDAVSQADMEQVQTFLDQGMSANTLDSCGESMLERAVDLGHVQVAHLLIERGANVNFQDDSGYTALTLAAEGGHSVMVNLLLDAGADMNVCGGSDAGTALHKAAREGNIEMVQLLLNRGADPNAKDLDGETVSYLQRLLFLKERPEVTLHILELLKNAGASV